MWNLVLMNNWETFKIFLLVYIQTTVYRYGPPNVNNMARDIAGEFTK